MTIGQLLGPALSGILIAAIGAQNALCVNAGAFLVSALCKLPLRLPNIRPHRTSQMFAASREDSKTASIVFVKQRLLFLLMIVASVRPRWGRRRLCIFAGHRGSAMHVGAVALGWLWSSLSVGILMTTAWLLWRPQQSFCARIWMIAVAAGVAAFAVPALLMSESVLVAAGLIAGIGATSGLITPLVSASLQERTPKDLMARVFGPFNTGTMGFP